MFARDKIKSDLLKRKKQNENYDEISFEILLFNSNVSLDGRLGERPSIFRECRGKPFFSECSDSRETNLTLGYPGLALKLIGDGKRRNFRVLSVEITSSNWSVASGIKIGASLKTARENFGEPTQIENESGNRRLIYFHKGEGSAVFHFRANKLVKVSTASDLC